MRQEDEAPGGQARRRKARARRGVERARLVRLNLEDVLDLPGPRDDGALEHVDAVLVAHSLVARVRAVGRRQGQERLALGLADGHVHVRDELVHVLQDLLRHHFGPPVLVARIGQQRKEHLLRHCGQLLEGNVPEVAVENLRGEHAGVCRELSFVRDGSGCGAKSHRWMNSSPAGPYPRTAGPAEAASRRRPTSS